MQMWVAIGIKDERADNLYSRHQYASYRVRCPTLTLITVKLFVTYILLPEIRLPDFDKTIFNIYTTLNGITRKHLIHNNRLQIWRIIHSRIWKHNGQRKEKNLKTLTAVKCEEYDFSELYRERTSKERNKPDTNNKR